MDLCKVLEMLGRKQVQLEDQDLAYQQILQVLAGVVSGQIERSRLLVNLSARTWDLCAPGQRPGLPSQINGMPICVVAPEEPEEALDLDPEEIELSLRNGHPE